MEATQNTELRVSEKLNSMLKSSPISPNLNNRIRSLNRVGSPKVLPANKVKLEKPQFSNNLSSAQKMIPEKSSLPRIGKLSDCDSPDACSEDEMNLDDDTGVDLGTLNFHMSKSSVVGGTASSGRGLKNMAPSS